MSFVTRALRTQAANLRIISPKRVTKRQHDWEAFFPYYAGFPESFATSLLGTAGLSAGGKVLDPWNGSGTTTLAASRLGLDAVGFDINPVMAIVARARLLPATEADSLEPLGREVLAHAVHEERSEVDPLDEWFTPDSVGHFRSVEASIRRSLLGNQTLTPNGIAFGRMSAIAGTFYVALFSVCRDLANKFQSSNPTWLRHRRRYENRVAVAQDTLAKAILNKLAGMARALSSSEAEPKLPLVDKGQADILVADATKANLEPATIDFVLTSPPYCTRIDYTAATRLELALLHRLLSEEPSELSRRMVGSVRVPDHDISLSDNWGQTATDFLRKLKLHPSKASDGYYLKTHLDYFQKLERSFVELRRALKPGAHMVIVVQDSFYKEIHNDLPLIATEMAGHLGFRHVRTDRFELARTMSRINPRARAYHSAKPATESVIVFAN